MKIQSLAMTLVLSGGLACSPLSVHQLYAERDTTDILIDVLVAKGILTAEEAINIRDEVAVVAEAERALIVDTAVAEVSSQAGPAPTLEYSAIPMPKSLKTLKLYGDARFRVQAEEVNDNDTRIRTRYRARFGADFNYADSPFTFGVRLDSALSNDSTNVTYGGFWDKTDDDVKLGLLYVTYKGERMTIHGGKHKSPFQIDNMFWDSDLTPEGLSEIFNFGSWDLQLGQYLIDDEREDRGGGDDFMFVGQAKWANDNGLSISPMFMTTTNGVSKSSELGQFIGENSIRDFRDFFVVAVPAEFSFEANGVKQKVFGTVGMNLKGGDAVTRVGSPFYNDTDTGDQDLFFNLGYTYGSASKAGKWQAGINYVYIEGASMTPNLSDSDFGKNSTNHHGFVLQYKYAFTDFFNAGFTYMDSKVIDDDYTADVVANEKAKLLQVDAAVKF